jgi:protein-L-isoaspartate(D-aspartate) O-methyltransferase
MRAERGPWSMWLVAALALLAAPRLLAGKPKVDFAERRAQMVEEIAADARLLSFETDRPTIAAPVIEALRKVPRHEFVPADQRAHAYENRPLPIGHGQTISQPYIVALMTDLLELSPDDVVLEIGTGSGYQAAVAVELAKSVYTIEIIEELGRQAGQRLKQLGYANVEVKLGDGYYGWEAHAPYDAIIVTAAASHIPPALIQQLRPGGKMVIPIGTMFLTQHLMLVEKNTDGTVRTRQVAPVQFVPLTGAHP